ncbi:hypothetical protein GOP47_0018438 [Adiantum capillus-veneris]|nr:hypothetical protein GOP47_0018438 [Adiantum capillus-veneris]
MPIYTEDWETLNALGRDPFRRVFVGETLQQMASLQIEHRIKRQNCGNNVSLHHDSIFGSRDQVGSSFSVANGEAEGRMRYPPRTMSPGFYGLTGEGNRAFTDRNFPPAEIGSSSSFGFQSHNGILLRSSVTESEIVHYPGSDSLGNQAGSPYTQSRSGNRSAFKRKSSMDDVLRSVGSSTLRPTLEQRGRNFSWLTEEANTSRAETAVPPLSSDLVTMGRIPVLDNSSYPRDNMLLSQLPKARPLQHLPVGSNRYYGGHSNQSQEVQLGSGRGSPDNADMLMSHTWFPRGALGNEYMMPSAQSPPEIAPINQGSLSSAVVPWFGNGAVSGESSMNHSHTYRDFNTGTRMGSQARSFPNGASLWTGDPYLTRYTFETSNSGIPGFPCRESTLERPYQGSISPLYSGHTFSWHPPAVPLISHNGFNGQGGPLPYRRAATDSMIVGSRSAPGSAYSSFGFSNRSAVSPPFRGPTESVGASPLHDYGMPFRGSEMLAAHRDSGQRLPSHEAFNHALSYSGFDIQDHHFGLQPDVDNMSYEELLALEERIGNVNTGISQENICKCLKTSKHSSNDVTMSVSQESEIKCSICQEEYMEGDELGQLNCGHTYHTGCIKQWLVLKNQCPVCKAAALS